MGWLVIIGSVPIILLGVPFQDPIETGCATCGSPPRCSAPAAS